MKQLKALFLGLILTGISQAQSTNVFYASYFSKNNSGPLLASGKGFHINDLYRQTRSCFTAESIADKNLVSRNAGVTTKINMYYTKTSKEFNEFRSKGMASKISFLNFFSLGSQMLDEYANRTSRDVERLIFKANVDFGIYSFGKDPILTAEAKNLINQNKLQEFVKMYGTHYISEIRKENSITVILTKKENQSNVSTGSRSLQKARVIVPMQGSGSTEFEDRNWANNELKTNSFSVSVEIKGPTIDQGSIQSDIGQIISGNQQDKLNAISQIIEAAIQKLSDPSQAFITQYYYSPFSLYGLNGIHWDEKKQNQLIKINEAVMQVYTAKYQLDKLIAPGGKDELLESQLGVMKGSEIYSSMVVNKYNEILPGLRALDQEAESRLKELEIRYSKCSDIYCPNEPDCCDNDAYITELSNYDFNTKVEQEIDKIKAVVKELNRPECEKQQKGIVIIRNTSPNPYNIYSGDQFLEVLPGNASGMYYVGVGQYNFKAIQKSGYVFYATKNNRSGSIINTCQEIRHDIGAED